MNERCRDIMRFFRPSPMEIEPGFTVIGVRPKYRITDEKPSAIAMAFGTWNPTYYLVDGGGALFKMQGSEGLVADVWYEPFAEIRGSTKNPGDFSLDFQKWVYAIVPRAHAELLACLAAKEALA